MIFSLMMTTTWSLCEFGWHKQKSEMMTEISLNSTQPRKCFMWGEMERTNNDALLHCLLVPGIYVHQKKLVNVPSNNMAATTTKMPGFRHVLAKHHIICKMRVYCIKGLVLRFPPWNSLPSDSDSKSFTARNRWVSIFCKSNVICGDSWQQQKLI